MTAIAVAGPRNGLYSHFNCASQFAGLVSLAVGFMLQNAGFYPPISSIRNITMKARRTRTVDLHSAQGLMCLTGQLVHGVQVSGRRSARRSDVHRRRARCFIAFERGLGNNRGDMMHAAIESALSQYFQQRTVLTVSASVTLNALT